jgi:hypothetical protein
MRMDELEWNEVDVSVNLVFVEQMNLSGMWWM